MNEDNERWLSDGNCEYCRRESYCTKECTALKRRKYEIIRELIRNRTGLDKIDQVLNRNW